MPEARDIWLYFRVRGQHDHANITRPTDDTGGLRFGIYSYTPTSEVNMTRLTDDTGCLELGIYSYTFTSEVNMTMPTLRAQRMTQDA